eukprot:gene12491-14662_t
MACSKDLVCEDKCARSRNCTKHKCKRRCCAGDCPPCEEVAVFRVPCRSRYTVLVDLLIALCPVEQKREQKLLNAPNHAAFLHCATTLNVDHTSATLDPVLPATTPALPGSKDVNTYVQVTAMTTKPLIEFSATTIHAIMRDKPIVYPPQMTLEEMQCPPCLVPESRECQGEHSAQKARAAAGIKNAAFDKLLACDPTVCPAATVVTKNQEQDDEDAEKYDKNEAKMTKEQRKQKSRERQEELTKRWQLQEEERIKSERQWLTPTTIAKIIGALVILMFFGLMIGSTVLRR